MNSVIPYIGGKHRISMKIGEFLHATGADTLVDVFGGSGAVVLNAGFQKRIYNDADGDLVNLMSVIADPEWRSRLFDLIRSTPASRKIFEAHRDDYIAHGFSFAHITDSAKRAFRTFYRSQFAYGGKMRTGGFCLSCSDRKDIKELGRYRNSIGRLEALAEFWNNTALECLDFTECISVYGRRKNIVLFVDPPYVGTENYYSLEMHPSQHVFLAHQLRTCKASVVCTYYDNPLIRELYPEESWTWNPVQATKNSQRKGAEKKNATVWIIVRR